MRKEDKHKRFAKKLLQLSLEDGKVSSEKVDGVLQYMRTQPILKAKSILKYYLRYIHCEISKTNARVEYAGALSQNTLNNLKKQLSEYYKLDIELSTEENPDLLAGIKVHIGDDVWDNTVSTHLKSLAEK